MALQKRIELLVGCGGLAVGMVLFGHFVPLPGSEIARLGVELFFLLSGRLMAEILIYNQSPLPRFSWRRITRVVPALFVLVLVVALLAAGLQVFRPSTLEYASVLTFWSNYLFTFAPREPVFGHTWSLAIEEHSYIVLGFLAFALRRSPKASLVASGAMILLGFLRGAWLTWGEGLGFYEVYWRTDVRAASLFFGYFGFIWYREYGSALVDRLAGASPRVVLLTGLAVVVQFASVVPDPVKYTLGTVITGLLLLALEKRARDPGLRDALVARGFEDSRLLWMGKVSYSVYLYQQVFHAMKADLSVVFAPLFIVPALLAGYVSWRWIEQPARRALNNLHLFRTFARSS